MLYLVLVLVVASLGLLIAALTTANTLWAWISVIISVFAGVLMLRDWAQNRRRRSQEAPATGHPVSVSDEPPAREWPAEEPMLAPAARPPAQAAVPHRESDASDFDESFEAFEKQLQDPAPLPIDREPSYETPVFGEPPFGTTPPEPVTAVQEPVTDLPPESATGYFRPVEDALQEPESATVIQRPVAPPDEATAFQRPVSPPDQATAFQRPVSPPELVTAVQQPVLDANIEPPEEATDATDLLVVSELSAEVVVIDERPRYHLDSCAWLGNRPILPLPVSEARDLGFTPCALCSPDSTLAAQQRARS
ncbi:hypothetical protein LWC34_32260 [Kibdelosporangium philippinense]|uniref:Uncharacterized protein n=1 Tax=Kibdelosporangium philippinense TaxID=211113 RepID=A0ABS8ZI17_9PSEU|nr:hypothetical protein [Kibdelosporangium philippinense]MCE7007459.1 hypothetical protein [Kibdelosporangium philippinense]